MNLFNKKVRKDTHISVLSRDGSASKISRLIRTVTLGMASTLFFGFGATIGVPAQAEQVDCQSHWAQNAIFFLEQRLEFRPPFVFCLEMLPGDSEVLSLIVDHRDILMSNNHLVVAECDEDCSDVDIAIYDSTGGFIDSDTTSDSFAAVRLSNLYVGAVLNVEVTMYNCQANYCGVVVGTMPVQ